MKLLFYLIELRRQWVFIVFIVGLDRLLLLYLLNYKVSFFSRQRKCSPAALFGYGTLSGADSAVLTVGHFGGIQIFAWRMETQKGLRHNGVCQAIAKRINEICKPFVGLGKTHNI